jgi:early secretory antigenic target protein ESAT-6
MTRYQVDSEAVLSATATVQGSIGRIQAEVAGLHGQLVDLQGSWSGSAATAFQAVVAEWKGTQQRVEEALASINQALSAAARQYAEVEEGNARMFAH